MHETQLPCPEVEVTDSELCGRPSIVPLVSVPIVPEHRMVDLVEMPAGLVSASGVELDLNEAEPGLRVASDGLAHCPASQCDKRSVCIGGHTGTAFERSGHPANVVGVAADYRKVSFGRGPISELEREGARRLSRERDHHDAACHAIEPMHEMDWSLEFSFQYGLNIWGMSVQGVPVGEHGRWFVYDNDLVVLVEDPDGAAALGNHHPSFPVKRGEIQPTTDPSAS